MTTAQKKSASEDKTPPMKNKTYQGKNLATIRDAISGDAGFNGTPGQQAVVRFEDGEEKTVMYAELDE